MLSAHHFLRRRRFENSKNDHFSSKTLSKSKELQNHLHADKSLLVSKLTLRNNVFPEELSLGFYLSIQDKDLTIRFIHSLVG